MEENNNNPNPNDLLFDQFLRIAELRGFGIQYVTKTMIRILKDRACVTFTLSQANPQLNTYDVNLDWFIWWKPAAETRRITHTDITRLTDNGITAIRPWSVECLYLIIESLSTPQALVHTEQCRQAFIQLMTEETDKRLEQANEILLGNGILCLMQDEHHILFRATFSTEHTSIMSFNNYLQERDEAMKDASKEDVRPIIARLILDKSKSLMTREWNGKLELLKGNPERPVSFSWYS